MIGTLIATLPLIGGLAAAKLLRRRRFLRAILVVGGTVWPLILAYLLWTLRGKRAYTNAPGGSEDSFQAYIAGANAMSTCVSPVVSILMATTTLLCVGLVFEILRSSSQPSSMPNKEANE